MSKIFRELYFNLFTKILLWIIFKVEPLIHTQKLKKNWSIDSDQSKVFGHRYTVDWFQFCQCQNRQFTEPLCHFSWPSPVSASSDTLCSLCCPENTISHYYYYYYFFLLLLPIYALCLCSLSLPQKQKICNGQS